MDEREQHQTWTIFGPLIHLLLAAQESGVTRPSRSIIASILVQSDEQVYRRAGVQKFRDYTALAEEAGIIRLGGKEGDAWIALHPNWFDVDGITTTRSPSNRVSSPTSDPPNVTQSPLLTGCKTPPIEAAIVQTPTSASPKSKSLESSGPLPTLPTNQQDSPPRASIPSRFQPLIDILTRMRTAGFDRTLRSLVGQSCNKDIYAQAGVSGFAEYISQASEAQLVQVGGDGGHAWVRLHPELRV